MRYLCKMKTGDKDTIMRDDNGKYPFYVRSPHIEHINTYSYDGEAVLMAGTVLAQAKYFITLMENLIITNAFITFINSSE